MWNRNKNLFITKARKYENTKLDGFVKSRHSGENRSPDGLQLPERTGMTKVCVFDLL